MNDKNVLFAGYRVPHPLEHNIELKIQTKPNSTPRDALTSAVSTLQKDLSKLQQQFRDQVQKITSKGHHTMEGSHMDTTSQWET